MKKLEGPVTLSDWCNALMASTPDQLEWLARDPKARAIVNDSWFSTTMAGTTQRTLIEWLVEFEDSIDPLPGIRFLVERAGAKPSAGALGLAVVQRPVNWPLVDYLEKHGARHVSGHRAGFHVDALLHYGMNQRAVQCMWTYRHMVGWESLSYSTRLCDLLATVMQRSRQACRVACVVAGLHRRRPDLMSRDVARLIARHLISLPLVVSEQWDVPPHWLKEASSRLGGMAKRVGVWLFSHDMVLAPKLDDADE